MKMKKKTKRKAAQRPEIKVAVPPSPEPRDACQTTIALAIRLPCAYRLLGYYKVPPSPGGGLEGPAFALVSLHDGEAQYATYQVVNDGGLCTLGHYYGVHESAEAYADFHRRIGVTGDARKPSRKPTAREAWEVDIAQRAVAQEAARNVKPAAPAPTTNKPTKEKR